MPKYNIPEDVQRAFDADQVIDLLAADDSVGAVRIIAQYAGVMASSHSTSLPPQ